MRPLRRDAQATQRAVSIHAPTRGATLFVRTGDIPCCFNPRTHAGCDAAHRRPPVVKKFQSTHPRGVRPLRRDAQATQRAVSIHAPTRGATLFVRTGDIPCCFNPRTHAGCDAAHRRPPVVKKFQSTHPRGVRLIFDVEMQPICGFNPRTHAGCDRSARPWRARCPGFNPRTHAGCDSLGIGRCGSKRVSIHAPTRGATNHIYIFRATRAFQSTHPRGVRRSRSPIMAAAPGFNPRTHAGCDEDGTFEASCVSVSIHAPTRGATPYSDMSKVYAIVSIHAPTRGATSLGLGNQQPSPFQSTHPRGVRRALLAEACNLELVSIHAPTRGATEIAERHCKTNKVSIHAPTRGATIRGYMCHHNQDVSIHAPTRGATHHDRAYANHLRVSIHAPTRGATSGTGINGHIVQFQSTHPRGVRQEVRYASETEMSVSIHAPTRGATVREYHDEHEEVVSIHAPTRGATEISMDALNIAQSFNPRTHAGCDYIKYKISTLFKVSIHAPTRGATTRGI